MDPLHCFIVLLEQMMFICPELEGTIPGDHVTGTASQQRDSRQVYTSPASPTLFSVLQLNQPAEAFKGHRAKCHWNVLPLKGLFPLSA